MTILRISWYCDMEGFQRTFGPIGQALERGELGILRDAAHERAHLTPAVWPLVEAMRYYPDDLGNEDTEFEDLEARIRFWITIILASFCQPTGRPLNATATLEVLHRYELRDEVVTQLWRGKPLGALLLPSIKHKTDMPDEDPAWPYWARGYDVGWLDSTDIQRLLSVLTLQKRYMVEREATMAEAAADSPTYASMIAMLTSALTQRKCLLVGVTA
jgi:hypothetical protein